jgi:hypothetical protein
MKRLQRARSHRNRGRWFSRDPLADPAFIVLPRANKLLGSGGKIRVKPAEMTIGPNIYEYCRDNPLKYTDKLGLDVTWSPAPCEKGETKFIQTVFDAPWFTIGGINVGTRAPFTDDGTHGGGTAPGPINPPYYPNTYPGTFDDNPSPNSRTNFLVCRVCVCGGKIISTRPCIPYSANYDGDLSDLGQLP